MARPEVEILLVEDNPHDAELTLRALRARNLSNRLHHVADGIAALDFLLGTGTYAGRPVEETPRVVLLDLKLPRMSGLEVLERIRSDARTRNVPVVVLTSSREAPDVTQAYRLGANSYIVKPVEFDRFTEAVADLGLYWTVLNEPLPL
jgi:CheY-like chemotaxis protein